MSRRRTLVVAPNWVGDLVMAQPTLAALAASGRELGVLAKPHLEPLLALMPSVAEVVARPATDRETVAALAARGYDEAVALPNSFRSAWWPWRARIPRRWGYRGNLRSILLTDAVRRPRHRRAQIDDYRELLDALGAPLGDDPTPRLELVDRDRAAGRALLERTAPTPGPGPLVGLFPGAGFGASKRWPVERFGELTHELRRSGARPLVVAGPKEIWLAVKVHEASGRLAPVVGPDLDLAELASVLAHLDLLVTNDSGPMHLAAALGVPCVAFFGPTDRRRTAPAGEGHAVLSTDRWCAPCFRRRCPLLHHRCLRDIGVERAAAAARAIRSA